jgi:predicted helicase
MLLAETGYKPKKEQRFNIYLTNSLEEHHPDTGTLFANWLSSEANQANHIKRDTPVMVVMGNPPYSVSSSNKSEWIQNLITDYKKDLNERKINLDDDYIKFIRYGQHFIDKNGSGVLAYISNNSFIDGITHRQMRKHLLESFDKIYILDLHGSTKKSEKALDGSKDENVFDIQQGVSINIFIKTNQKKKEKLAEVNHFELYGTREKKYSTLTVNNLDSIKWNKLAYKEPYYFFVPKDFADENEYEKGFKIENLYLNNNTGIQTKKDGLVYQFNHIDLKSVIEDFIELPNEAIRKKYNLADDGRDWTIDFAKNDLLKKDGLIAEISYHPFDSRITYFTGRSKGFMAYPRSPLSNHCLKENLSLVTVRNSRNDKITNFLIVNKLVDKDGISPLDNCKFFPLYLYPEPNAQQIFGQTTERTPNLNAAIVNQLAEKLGLTFVPEKEPEGNVCFVNNPEVRHDFKTTFAPIDILDYIYAVLHSPTYREKYKEFLKIDFPRVPYPKDAETFWQLVELGGEIRQIHLLEAEKVNQYITSYPNDGNNTVTRKMTTASPGWEAANTDKTIGRVWINDQQYFDGVPLIAWEFYIGGYQPAQKWLKDRHSRTLNFEDILHYQKIIVALTETHRLMQEVDKVGIE